MLEEAPVPILVGRDIMELAYLKGAQDSFEVPYHVNVVTCQQSRKVKVGGRETTQSKVTQVAVEAGGRKEENSPN